MNIADLSPPPLDRAAVIELLRVAVRDAGSVSAWAAQARVSAVYTHEVLRGSRPPGPSVLAALGIERTTVYARVTS